MYIYICTYIYIYNIHICMYVHAYISYTFIYLRLENCTCADFHAQVSVHRCVNFSCVKTCVCVWLSLLDYLLVRIIVIVRAGTV